MTRRGLLAGCAGWSVRAAGAVQVVDVETGKRSAIEPGESAATVLLFLSAVCPISNDYQERIQHLLARYAGQRVRFYILGSNVTESEADLRAYGRDVRFGVPVYRDFAGEAARRFGATVTPEAVALDASGEVRYRGAIDDARKAARVKKEYLREAVDALLAGKPVETAVVRAFGCAIKAARRGS